MTSLYQHFLRFSMFSTFPLEIVLLVSGYYKSEVFENKFFLNFFSINVIIRCIFFLFKMYFFSFCKFFLFKLTKVMKNQSFHENNQNLIKARRWFILPPVFVTIVSMKCLLKESENATICYEFRYS